MALFVPMLGLDQCSRVKQLPELRTYYRRSGTKVSTDVPTSFLQMSPARPGMDPRFLFAAILGKFPEPLPGGFFIRIFHQFGPRRPNSYMLTPERHKGNSQVTSAFDA